MIRLLALPAVTLLLGFIFTEPVTHSAAASTDYPEHLTGAFTGGFEEETCRSCHFDYDLNPEGGRLWVSGIPDKISSGETVEITIKVEREELGSAGFQLSARFEDGSQAGRFKVGGNDRIMFSASVPDSLQYVQHTREGTELSEENKNSWVVRWQAPESVTKSIIFNVAANAGNGDQSEFGDFIYANEIKTEF